MYKYDGATVGIVCLYRKRLVFVLCLWSSPINDKKSLPVGVVVATLAFSVGVVVLSLRSTISNSEDVDVAVLLLQQADSRLEVMVLDAEVLLAHTFDDVSATACRCSTKSFTTSWMIAKLNRRRPVYDKSFACGKMAAECMRLSVGVSGSNHANLQIGRTAR